MLCVKIYQYGQNGKIQLKMQKEIEKFIAYLKIERNYALNTQQAYEKDLCQLLEFLREKGIANWSDVTTEHLNLLVMKMRHHGISGRRTLMPTSSARFLIISCTDLVLILCILLFKNRAPCVTLVFAVA
jgi:integrase/recombinase XerC